MPRVRLQLLRPLEGGPVAANERGVGRELMAALHDEARASGKHMIAAIDGRTWRRSSSINDLASPKWLACPKSGAKFGQWQDLVLMQLRLDDRTAPDDG